jgi:hypothetical protein
MDDAISFATTCILLLLTCVKSISTKLSYTCSYFAAAIAACMHFAVVACIKLLNLYVAWNLYLLLTYMPW